MRWNPNDDGIRFNPCAHTGDNVGYCEFDQRFEHPGRTWASSSTRDCGTVQVVALLFSRMSKKRLRRTDEATACLAGVLDANQAATLARVECDLAELTNAAPDVPELAEMLQLAKTLRTKHRGASTGEAAAVAPFDALPVAVVEVVLLHCDARSNKKGD